MKKSLFNPFLLLIRKTLLPLFLTLVIAYQPVLLYAQCGGIPDGIGSIDDYDRDGICNNDDLDDDNDGILDTDECSSQRIELTAMTLNNTTTVNFENNTPKLFKDVGGISGFDVEVTPTGDWGSSNTNSTLALSDNGTFSNNSPTDRLENTYQIKFVGTVLPLGVEVFSNNNLFAINSASGVEVINERAEITATASGTVTSVASRILICNQQSADQMDVIGSGTNTHLYRMPLPTKPDKGLSIFNSCGFVSTFESPRGIEGVSFLYDLINHKSNDAFTGQSFHITVTLCSDLDKDGISNHFDLDTDGDGCPDAIEGDANFDQSNMVNSQINGGNSGSKFNGSFTSAVTTNLGNAVDANGIPNTAGAGQTVGSSADLAVNACCTIYKPDIQLVLDPSCASSEDGIIVFKVLSDSKDVTNQTAIADFTTTNGVIHLDDDGRFGEFFPVFVLRLASGATSSITLDYNGCPVAKNFTMPDCPRSLPVELKSFQTSLNKDNKLLIEWEVAQENGVHSYTLQRSFDAINFHNIYTVKSLKTIDPYTYSYEDITASGDNYYRLRYKDHSEEKTSQIIYGRPLKKLKEPLLRAYPNPLDRGQNLQLKNSDGMEEIIKAVAVNTFGQARDIEVKKANKNIYLLKTNSLPSGSYTLILQTKTQKQTINIIYIY